MTVEELIMELENLPPDAEVRFAGQPNWPFEYSIASVNIIYEEGDDPDDIRDDHSPVVYLAEGMQLAYLPEHVKEELGW